jgi:hypothetical protein
VEKVLGSINLRILEALAKRKHEYYYMSLSKIETDGGETHLYWLNGSMARPTFAKEIRSSDIVVPASHAKLAEHLVITFRSQECYQETRLI